MGDELGYDDAIADDASESSPKSIGKRLGMLIDRIGMDKSVLIADKSTKQLKRYCEGAEPPFTVLKRLTEATGATLEWITYGSSFSTTDIELDILESEQRLAEIEKELSKRPRPIDEVRAQLHKEADLHHHSVAVQRYRLGLLNDMDEKVSGRMVGFHGRPMRDSDERGATLSEGELISVPRYNVSAAAGDGILPANEADDMDSIVLARNFIRRLGGTPEACQIIFACGESMLPTIPDGSLLLVDRSNTSIKDNAVFVFRVGDAIKVKRARRRIDQCIDLVSDNQVAGYPPETYSPKEMESITPLGRVICVMRSP